jgi:Glycoside-hydrolase family GH114
VSVCVLNQQRSASPLTGRPKVLCRLLTVLVVGGALLLPGCAQTTNQRMGEVSDTDSGQTAAGRGRPSYDPGPPAPISWRPPSGEAWQWQLSGPLDLSVDVPIYDIDWETPSETIEKLHQLGRRVICYVSVGTWESYRSDAGSFPEPVLGRSLDNYPNERWLDIRQLETIGPPLLARLDRCRDKGFDAVEPDNVDAYANNSGFPLTAQDQIRFNRWIAAAAHARGMSVGLKNDLDQVGELVSDFDFAVNEQCFEYNECEALRPFVDAGKAVLHVEYNRRPDEFCPTTANMGFSSMHKRRELDAYRVECKHDRES